MAANIEASSSSGAVVAAVGTCVALAIGAAIARSAISKRKGKNDRSNDDGPHRHAAPAPPAFLADPTRGPRVASLLASNLDVLSDESLLKIVRVLEFWHGRQPPSSLDDDDDFVALADRRIRAAMWPSRVEAKAPVSASASNRFVPRVRFGRTEMMMPVVTCGGMRLQETWVPDFIPVLRPRRSRVLRSACQDHVIDIVRTCLRLGMNHFETARFYGTSEYQLVDALARLMETGEIQREDFIFQTKVPAFTTGATFRKFFDQSWANVEKLGHIDLFAFHCVAGAHNVDNVLDDAEDMPMATALRLKAEGKIRHIGFSTHGTAEDIMRLISSDKFDFVNLHYHYFGSYHAEGTPDTMGGHGNLACVKKALELDMGVFNISPVDKGGKLFKPSAAVALDVGPELTPIAFAALYAWKKVGMHTISVGVGRISDLDEVLEAAALFAEEEGGACDDLLSGAQRRLEARAVNSVGADWVERGLLNLPTCYDKSSNGVAIGHVLWLHTLMSSYGMYDFCKARYSNLENCGWKDKKTFEENAKKMSPGNPGRGYIATVNLDEALSAHYCPELVKKKMAECHDWLRKDADFKEEERKDRGWDAAYDLTTWEVYPRSEPSLKSILLQSFTWGKFGGGGPSEAVSDEASIIRLMIKRNDQRS